LANSWNEEELRVIEEYLDGERIAEKPTALLPWAQHYLPQRFTCEPSLLHGELAEDLDAIKTLRDCNRCYIAPRGAAKSTLVTLADVLKDALEGREFYQIIIADVQVNANKFLKDIKDEIETNEQLQADYPDTCRKGAMWRGEAIELANRCCIEVVSKGGKIRGRKHRGVRPTKIVLDDPQSLEDSYSEDQMDKDFHWLMSDVMYAGQPGTNLFVIGTALADKAIVCQLAKTPGWKHKRYQQLIQEPTNMELWLKWREMLWNHEDPQRDEKAREWYFAHQTEMDFGHQVLWEKRVPLLEVMWNRYTKGERAFQSEQQGIPMPPGDAEWPMEYFDWPGFWFDDYPSDVTMSAYALDPSKGKESKQGDFQALGYAACNPAGTIFIEAWLEKMDSQSLMDFAVDRWSEKPAEAFAMETNCFQELLKIPLEKSVKAKNATLKLPLVEIINTVKKEVRIRRHTPYLAGRQYRFRNTPGTRMLVDMLKKFPFAEHDDGPDMLEMLLRVLIQLSHVKKGR